MNRLDAVRKAEDIYEVYRNAPIGQLLEYHNLSKPFSEFENAEILIGTCMDNRITLNIPDRFAFIIRKGGADLQNSRFHISFAISIGQLSHFAVIGHSDCGMVDLRSRKTEFVKGLEMIAGWNKQQAEEHFRTLEPAHETINEIGFILSQVSQLRKEYPKIEIAPLFYRVEDNLLYQINESR